jgi:hypothetical protein
MGRVVFARQNVNHPIKFMTFYARWNDCFGKLVLKALL